MSQFYRLYLDYDEYDQVRLIEYQTRVNFKVEMADSFFGFNPILFVISDIPSFVYARFQVWNYEWTDIIKPCEPRLFHTENRTCYFPELELEEEFLIHYLQEDGVPPKRMVHVKLELKLVNCSIGSLADPIDGHYIISVRNREEPTPICLFIPPEVLNELDGPMVTKLRQENHVHYEKFGREELDNISNLLILNTELFLQVFHFSPKLFFHMGLLQNELLSGEALNGTFLQPFYNNMYSMSIIDSQEDFENVTRLLLPIPACKRLLTVSLSNRLDPVNCYTFCWSDSDNWQLYVFESKYGEEPEETFLGFTLTHMKREEWGADGNTDSRALVNYDIKMSFVGMIPSEKNPDEQIEHRIEFHLSNQPGDARFGYGCPTAMRIEDLVKIGLNDNKVTLSLEVEEYRTPIERNEEIVTFVGVTDYTIKTKKTAIKINKHVLLDNSEVFNMMYTGDFVENGRNYCDLPEDDDEALILLLEIVYGFAIPLNYSLLTRLMIVATKYMFWDMKRYFDVILTRLARETKLPVTWMINAEQISLQFGLIQLEDHARNMDVESYISVKDPELNHQDMIDFLRACRTKINKVLEIEDKVGQWFKQVFGIEINVLEIEDKVGQWFEQVFGIEVEVDDDDDDDE